MVSFCFFFFVNNVVPTAWKRTVKKGTHKFANSLAPGYVFPGCNPHCRALRHRPFRGDWMHPGSTFAGLILDSLMGRRLSPSVPLVWLPA